MSLSSWFSWPRSRGQARRGQCRNSVSRPRTARLFLEHVEDRALLSGYTAATVSDLIADINAANKAGGSNTIALVANTTFALTKVNNTTDGPTGLPVISGGKNQIGADILTITGNGDTIERSTDSDFRLFDVASGASLTLENLTLYQGEAFGSGKSASGGAIINQGTLVLSGTTVNDNFAVGSNGPDSKGSHPPGNGQDAFGGGIWSIGSLTMENGTLVQNNKAEGGIGGAGNGVGNGGAAYGGGVYIAGGTVSLTSATLSSNIAQGGNGGHQSGSDGNGGAAYGGGVYIAGGTASLTSATLSSNIAQGGYGVLGYGYGFGGGLYVAGGTVTLTSDTVEFDEASSLSSYGPSFGGGVYVAGGTVTLTGDTVESNNTGYYGYGGGIFIASGTVYLDSFTVANTINNFDSSGLNGSTANIDGTYILLP